MLAPEEIMLIFLILILVFIIFIWYNPSFILNPINFIYSIDSVERKDIYSECEKLQIFPTSKRLEKNWRQIKDEGNKLYNTLENKKLNYLDNYNINLGDENKNNWTTIPLRLFGRDIPYYLDKCNKLGKIIKAHPEIISCIFSIMEPGKIIKPHYGPYDGLIRYQLALEIPPRTNKAEECYLYVENKKYNWIEGNGVLFDETMLHGAVNTTSHKRIVLLIDIERPYTFFPFSLLNKFIIKLLGLIPTNLLN